MKSAENDSITIIGVGALGSTLLKFFEENQIRVRSVWNSQGGRVYNTATSDYEEVSKRIPDQNEEIGEIVFITTPDDLISQIAHELSERPVTWNNKIVVHCSGNLTSDELLPLQAAEAKTVSMHPIQSFTKGDGSERFRNITISFEGDDDAVRKLIPMVDQMGANSIRLDKKQKRFLHIAAVMASNYLVGLLFAVEQLLKDADIPDAFDSLETLVNQTTSNIFQKGPSEALTGPISRGDVESIQTHLDELEGGEFEGLYRLLGVEVLNIIKSKKSLPDDRVKTLEKLLKDP